MGNAKYKQKHKELGLCVNCSNPIVHGETRCAECSYNHNIACKKYYYKYHALQLQKAKEKKEKLKEQNRCPVCCGPNDTDSVCCSSCNQGEHKISGSKNFRGWHNENHTD